jgi:ferredoxin-nitrite reductase
VGEQVERLVGAWLAEKRGRNGRGFSFQDFCDAHSDEELRAVAAGQPRPGAPPETVTVERASEC